ncbi:unnamed protein product [Clonostachys solani]|uniref:Peptidase C14 caspase domain-containing protein n=1 Tax=Clonostachys solani TaxID=160281 RepID=A0A9N9ZFY4_9HYPO|nr:unnamed protein product [Clonostachys solani]
MARWALLIGVDLYRTKEGGRWEDKTLTSAVHDVEALSSFLRDSLSPVNIIPLTASASRDPQENRPTESDEESWPTRENIDNALLNIREKAKDGDHVYIHFSGHGTRVGQALALVLYKHTPPYTDYYLGGTLLQVMSEKAGLIITVTLDCCESGSVQRSGISGMNPGARFIDYDSQVAAASFAATPPPLPPSPDNNLRGATVSSREWKVDPKSYNIFTACGEDEIAIEIPIGGIKRGAFSLILGMVLDYGARSTEPFTHDSLYDRLRIEFRSFCPSQTPRRIGSGSTTIFGTVRHDGNAIYPSLYIDKTEAKSRNISPRLYVEEGSSLGVSVGDTYLAIQFGLQAGAPGTSTQLCRVVEVQDNRSRLEKIVSEGEAVRSENWTGWRAKPLRSYSARRVPVLVRQKLEQRLQKPRTDGSWEGIRFAEFEWEEPVSRPCIFSLVLTDSDRLEILDASGVPVTHAPVLEASEPGAAGRILGILQHLVSYKYFETIENPTLPPGTQGSHDVSEKIKLLASAKQLGNDDTGPFEVQEGCYWNLRIRNEFTPRTNKEEEERSVYVLLAWFSPDWQVSNLLPGSGSEGSFTQIAPGKEKDITLKMDLEEEDGGKSECVCKVFITREPSRFHSMFLEPLGEQRSSTLNSADLICNLLDSLTTRGAGDWMTRNYTVTTVAARAHDSNSASANSPATGWPVSS